MFPSQAALATLLSRGVHQAEGPPVLQPPTPSSCASSQARS